MPYRIVPLVNDSFYHVFNRGVEKRIIFLEEQDFRRFIRTLIYYQLSGPKPPYSERDRLLNQDFANNPKIVEVVCYCLMPNHFHLVLRQLRDGGISEFLRKVINSYTKYFNTKYKRVGPLFQGVFKTVLIEDDFQLIHLSRYIHLNPYVSKLVPVTQEYPYSSYHNFIGLEHDPLCLKDYVLHHFRDGDDYKEFVEGYQDYAMELEFMKHILLEDIEL